MPVNLNDPRVRRTRQLMMQAFHDLLGEKRNIYSISVQDITTRAAVNRSTFYAHFEDKFDFLENWMAEKFHSIIHRRLSDDSAFSPDNLRILVQSVFHFLVQFRQYITPGDKQFEPMFEKAMQMELYRLLLQWMKDMAGQDDLQDKWETTALVVSWGVFGSALQWSRNTQAGSEESMVQDVLEIISVHLDHQKKKIPL